MNRIGKYEGVVRLVLLLVVLPAAVYRLSLGVYGRAVGRGVPGGTDARGDGFRFHTTGYSCRYARYGGTDRRRRSARSAGAP